MNPNAQHSTDPALYQLRCDYYRKYPVIKKSGGQYVAIDAGYRHHLFADTVDDLRQQLIDRRGWLGRGQRS